MAHEANHQGSVDAVYPTVAKTIADALGCRCGRSQARRVADRRPRCGIDRLPRSRLSARTRIQGEDPARQDRRGRARRSAGGGVRAEGRRHRRGPGGCSSSCPRCRPTNQAAAEGRGYSAAVHARDVREARGPRAARAAGALTGGSRGRMGRPERYAAFTFVDRITALVPGTSAKGTFHIPAAVEASRRPCSRKRPANSPPGWRFPSSVSGAARSPASRTRPCSRHRDPGETAGNRDPHRFLRGRCGRLPGLGAHRRHAVFELHDCVGPMLPLEDFDDPVAMRAFSPRCAMRVRNRTGSGGCRCMAPDAARAGSRTVRDGAASTCRAVLRRSLPAAPGVSRHASARPHMTPLAAGSVAHPARSALRRA